MICWPLLVDAVSFSHPIYFRMSISLAADIFFLLIGYDKPTSAFLESLVQCVQKRHSSITLT